MRNFLIRLSIFLAPVFLYGLAAALLMPTLLSWKNGPSTTTQITTSFKQSIERPYDLYIFGNSRMYRGIDPDCFAMKAYNFSHDSDSFNQIYYKLLYLLDHTQDFDYIVLGMDFFQFSFKSEIRNYAYSSVLGDDYMSDFESGKMESHLRHYFDNMNPKKLLSIRAKVKAPILKKNGHLITFEAATEQDSIERDIRRLKFQMQYFNKVISLCKRERIVVFMTMLPTRKNELASYTAAEMAEFRSYISRVVEDQNVFLLDYTNAAGYTIKDYTDVSHFNEQGARKFSSKLNDTIQKLIVARNLPPVLHRK
ncbi:MAG TPA: hypothetical protein VF676_09260 [Flavobacterium sp.]|jgi:hypothetical protein